MNRDIIIEELQYGLSGENAVGAKEFLNNLCDSSANRNASFHQMILPIARRVMDIAGWQNKMTVENITEFCDQNVKNMPPDDNRVSDIDVVAEWMVDKSDRFIEIIFEGSKGDL